MKEGGEIPAPLGGSYPLSPLSRRKAVMDPQTREDLFRAIRNEAFAYLKYLQFLRHGGRTATRGVRGVNRNGAG